MASPAAGRRGGMVDHCTACWKSLFPGHSSLPEPKTLLESRSQADSDHAIHARGKEYEVFLSFRGPDTRRGFADCLYLSMRDAGIRVFQDNEELRAGDEIGPRLRQDIIQSKISIPIFSKGYASSKWCLRELALIAECRKKGEQTVMPIFYDVTPDQVKSQTGKYREALHQHAYKYPECVGQWRSCLSEVGRLKGWVLKDATNGHEGQLIKLVVTAVLRDLKKLHLPLTKNLVGVKRHTDNIMSMLNVGASDVRIVGIYGISGVGKTTLAKHIYNELLNGFEFEGCSSLDNIRGRSLQPNGLEQLQSKLVADITRREHRDFVSSIDEGINMLKERFRDRKVLVLLDDVNHPKQLEALVAEREWFGPGSRIIVTTTNGCLLREAPQVNRSYEMGGMEHDEAFELFIRHAFRNDPSVDPYTARLYQLANEIVKAMGGLPLALEIIGSFLYGRCEKQWKAMHEKLKARADNRVLDKLRISYDDLEDEYKEMFLDVACFFIGVDIRVVAHMWEDCNFFPEVGIEVLQLRSLVKIGEDKKLWMHDSLRNLGREIVQQEDESPGRRSRLWRSEEAIYVLQEHMGTGNIKAISLPSHNNIFLEEEQFRKMSNVRYLRLDGAYLWGTLEPLSKLKWLVWQRNSITFLPTSLPIAKLKILDLSRSEISEDWTGWSSVQKPVLLKVLDLSGCCKLKKTPDLSMFPYLEQLILEDCDRLKAFHPSMLDLQRLSFLNLKGCSKVHELPDQLGSMNKMTELIIDGTSIVQLPDSIGSLENLQRLSANDCYRLVALPDSIGQLNSLVELSFSCTKIASLPDSVGNLNNLEVLNIASSDISGFPSALGKLGKLKVINAAKCENLIGNIPDELGKLCFMEVLKLDGTNVSRIPETIVGLSRLQSLDLSASLGLDTLPELPVSLVRLRVSCRSMEAIPNLPFLINLEELVWSTSTPRRRKSGKLLSIPMGTKKQEGTLPEFPISLHKLSLLYSPLHILPDLSNLRYLSDLSLEKCYNLVEILGLMELVVLKSLKMSWCPRITSLIGLERLTSLRVLEVTCCENLMRFPDLSLLQKLSVLNARGCESLVAIQGLDRLYAMTDLDIGNCKCIEELPDLSKLTLLRSLSADGCQKLQELKGLGKLEELLSLGISGCSKMKCLPNLSELKKLRHLNIAGCEGISEIRGLSKMRSLRHIVICKRASIGKLGELLEVGQSISTECPGTCSAPTVQVQPITGLKIAIHEGNILAIYPYEKARWISSTS